MRFTTVRLRSALMVVVMLAAGCSGGGASAPFRSGGPDGASPVEAEVGSVPTFEWAPIDGAALYRLAVLGSEGPIWAWEGPETTVNLGGLVGDRPEGMAGPVVLAGTSWSVAAFDEAGRVLEVVGPIVLSEGGAPTATSAEPESTAEPSASDLPDPCALVLQADVDALLGGPGGPGDSGDVSGPGDTVGGRSCSWSQGFGSTLRVSIFVRPGFLTPIDICSEYCEPIAGIGNEAWGGASDRGAGGALVAISVDGLGVQVSADGLGASVEQLIPLAESVLAGL